MTDYPVKVVKGDLSSVVHDKGEGPFGDSIWILLLLGVAKILLIASLVGIYYLFSWSPSVAFVAMSLLGGSVVLWVTKPWKAPKAPLPVEHTIDPHAQRAARYEAEGNMTMAEHTRRLYGLHPQSSGTVDSPRDQGHTN